MLTLLGLPEVQVLLPTTFPPLDITDPTPKLLCFLGCRKGGGGGRHSLKCMHHHYGPFRVQLDKES